MRDCNALPAVKAAYRNKAGQGGGGGRHGGGGHGGHTVSTAVTLGRNGVIAEEDPFSFDNPFTAFVTLLHAEAEEQAAVDILRAEFAKKLTVTLIGLADAAHAPVGPEPMETSTPVDCDPIPDDVFTMLELDPPVSKELVAKILAATKPKRGCAGLRGTDVLIDSAASIHIIRERQLLTDIRDTGTPVVIAGVGGALISTSWVGELPYVGTVLFHEGAIANILSLALMEDRYPVVMRHGMFEVQVDANKTLKFYRRSDKNQKLYVADFEEQLTDRRRVPAPLYEEAAVNQPSEQSLATILENELRVSAHELQMAKEARELIKRLGYPSEGALIEMLTQGMLIESRVTAHDVHRAFKIYGRDPSVLKGKTVAVKASAIRSEYVASPEQKEQSLHVDVMFAAGEAFLVSVSSPLHMVMATHLRSRSTQDVKKALFQHLASYSSEDFLIKTIFTDGEGAIAALQTELNAAGIAVNTTAAGMHVPIVERMNRTIKERVRSILASLPYSLPHAMLPYAVLYAVRCINMAPTKGRKDRVSPREAFIGRKSSAKLDCRISFGDYVQIPIVSTVVRNNLDPRTVGAIAVLPIGNRQGSVRFISLATLKPVTRDHWTALPTPAEVCNYLTSLARSRGRQIQIDVVEDVNEDDDGDEDYPSIVESPLRVLQGNAERNMEQAFLDPSVEGVAQQPAGGHQPGAESTEGGPVSDHVAGSGPHGPPPGLPPPPAALAGSAPGISAGSEAIDSGLRRSTRHKPAAQDPAYDYGMLAAEEQEVELGLHVALGKALAEHYDDTMEAVIFELLQMIDKKVFHAVSREDLSKDEMRGIIRSSLFLKYKHLPNGDFEKLKARLVAGGDLQDKSIYADLSSPTASLMSVMLTLVLAARERRTVCTIDIGGAYLNADLVEKVHMRLDKRLAKIYVELMPSTEHLLEQDGSMIVRLDKALYGCVESALLWYQHLKATLLKFGFVPSPIDACVYNSGTGKDQMTVCVHVDDLLVTCKSPMKIDNLVNHLINSYGEVKVNSGKVHSYLGMTIDFSTDREVKITQEHYVQEILETYHVTGRALTPAQGSLFVIDPDSPALSAANREEFHSRVAKLLYLAKHARPDLLTLVSFLATRVQCATDHDAKKLNHGLKYLNATAHMGLVLSAGDETMPLQVVSYVDASYGVHGDGKSHTGSIITLGKGAIHGKSSKQKIVTKSSTEAELIGLSDAATLVLWVREFLIHQGYPALPAIIYQDNLSTIRLASKGIASSDRTRHIAIRYYWMAERVTNGEIDVRHLSTDKMIADLLTKPLFGKVFDTLRDQLLNWEGAGKMETDREAVYQEATMADFTDGTGYEARSDNRGPPSNKDKGKGREVKTDQQRLGR